MSMDQLKSMKETLMAAAQGQMGNLEKVNAKELGEVIDMIKDLEEASYYCAVTKAMDESKDKQKEQDKINEAVTASLRMQNYNEEPHYYTPYLKYVEPYLEYMNGQRYYDGDGNSRGMRDGQNPNRMYYGGNGGMSNSSGGQGGYGGSTRGYREPMYPQYRDSREGISPMSRRGYMEAKENHQDKKVQMQELEKYVQELGQDIVEMVRDASPEEKNLLQSKLNALATKIN